MKLIRSSILITFLGLLITIPSYAQINSAENEQCNDEFALFLVSQQVSDGRNVTETAKKVRILTLSGDFIWQYDEPTARTYLAEAYKTAFDHYREKGIEWEKISSEDRSARSQVPDYRFEVLRTISKHDSAWGRKLVDEILADFEKNVKNRRPGQDAAELGNMLSMAVYFSDINKDLSWWVFRKVMEYPLDQYWYFNLTSLAGKDDQMAATLYSELLVRYRNSSPRQLLFLSAYPFRSDRMLGVDRQMYSVFMMPDLESRPDLQQQFLNTFFNRVASFAANPQERTQRSTGFDKPEPVYMMSALNDIEQFILEEMPMLLPRLAAAKAQTNALLSEDMRKDLEGYGNQKKAVALSFDERYELLEKADEEGKLTDGMIVNMIFGTYLSEEQYAQMEPWMQRIKEDELRKEVTNYFWFQRSWVAIGKERFADGEKYASKVPEIDHRSILAFQIAERQMKSYSEAASAYQTLNEVGKLVRTMENSAAKAKILMGLAYQYLQLNPGFAMEELAEAVRVINRTKDPDMRSGVVFRQMYSKSAGSWHAAFPLPGYNMEKTFEKMGETDFGLTLSNARAIEDKYLRTIAVISTAKNCIGKKKPVTDEATGN